MTGDAAFVGDWVLVAWQSAEPCLPGAGCRQRSLETDGRRGQRWRTKTAAHLDHCLKELLKEKNHILAPDTSDGGNHNHVDNYVSLPILLLPVSRNFGKGKQS